MKKYFTKNIGWKILSIAFAVILWIVVINDEDPLKTVTFTDIPLQMLNEEKITNQDKYINYKEGKVVTITIRGKRKAIEGLDKSDIKATADLGRLSFTNAAPIKIELNDQFEILKKEPVNLLVELENKSTEQKEIQPILEGEVEEYYIAKEAKLNPNIIELVGPESKIAKVASVIVTVKIDGASKDIELYAEPKIFDGNKMEIKGLGKNIEKIKVNVPVYKKKTVPLTISFDGKLQKGYVLKSYDISPKTITIYGSEENIDRISLIRLPVISLQEITSRKTIMSNTHEILPDSIMLMDKEPLQVGVSVDVEKEISRQYNIPIDEINVKYIPENMQFKYISHEDITIRLEGLKEYMDIDINDLRPSLSLKDLEKGEHELKVELNIPEELRLLNEDLNVTVELIDVEIEEKEEITNDHSDIKVDE